jgi:signal transduction histidine kinase/CheY-like chemotaxis protein
MPHLADIARLNVLIELFSECANAADLETLLRIAAGRLRWVVDFDRCTFVLDRGAAGRCCWIGTRQGEGLGHVAITDLPVEEIALIAGVIESGAPAGIAPGRICAPLQGTRHAIGAISLSTESGVYTYRDMRLGHHAGQYLGSMVSRLDLEDETRRLSRRKDDLLALLSHELRNPLGPIVTAVRLLKMRASGEPSQELDIIDRQSQQLVCLVDDLLDVARLTRGKIELRRAPVEIAQVIARGVEMATALLEERGHSLEVDVPSVGLLVFADEIRLAQVVSNLLNNAAHYTKKGGHVRIAARRDGESVVVEVADDGIGIAAEALASIFELFVQGPNNPSGEGGLGLGLVVVKELSELHGGTVSVVSEGSGCGATFTVRLPLAPASSVLPVPAAASLTRADAESRERILMIDDNKDALTLLSAFVAHAGHQVRTACGGIEALAVIDRFQPSVAVIDINMPGMDGYAVAARIRADYGGRQPYLVALTGYGQACDRQRTAAAGFHHHMVKPVDPDELLRVIGSVPSIASIASVAK